jgi:peptidoglycan/LPS O-acetylase OafA/YrhL
LSERHAHYPALDGVRGLAVLIVIGAHTNPQVFPGGNIGVDLFFILSGFLITTILLNEHKATGSISIKNFYARRALRLLPALVLLLICTIAYSWLFDNALLPTIWGNSKYVIGYVWNWYLSADWKPQAGFLRHLWSLSVEEQFYSVWPFVLILTVSRPRLFLAIILAGIVGPTIGRLLLWREGPSLYLYFRTDLRFDSLMWGALAAWLSFNRYAIPSPKILGGCALVAFLVLSRIDLLSGGFLYLGGYGLIGAMGFYLIVAGTNAEPRWLKASLEFRPLRWTGKISYGLYLWHVPMFYAARGYHLNSLVENVLALALSFAIATASYYGMEIWCLKYKPYSKPSLPSDSTVAQTASA